MKKINKKEKHIAFDKEIFTKNEPLFITSDIFWDGGISVDSSLEEKSKFYSFSLKMSVILKRFLLELNEKIYIGKDFCEYNKIYEQWSDLKEYELFRCISSIIDKKNVYQLEMPKDSEIIDLIIESNFRYFTHITFYLPESEIMIEPTCHSEILVYSNDKSNIVDLVNKSIGEYKDIIQCK